MARRRISDKQRQWLVEEVGLWQSTQIVSAEQVRRILDCYETADSVRDRKRSLFVFTVAGVASLFVALSFFLLISHNWSQIPGSVKIGGSMALTLLLHGLGMTARLKWQMPKLAEAATFLGCASFGGGIALIGQVYHLDAHWPDMLWWWAVGTLPFALAGETILLHLLFVGLLAWWAGAEVLGFRHLGFWRIWGVPNGAFSLPLLALPGVFWSYRRASVKGIGLYVPLFVWWVVLQGLAWDFERPIVFLIGIAGSLLMMLAEMHRPGNPLAIPFRARGTLALATALIPLSYMDFYKHNFWHYGQQEFLWPLGFIVSLAVLVGLVLTGCIVLRSHRDGGHSTATERLGQLLREQAIPVTLALFLIGLSLWTWLLPESQPTALIAVIVANAAMLLVGLWLLQVGLRDDRGKPFAAGVLYLILWGILRYIDLFGDIGMLGGAGIFFGCGAVLFGIAWWWHHRHLVIQT